MRSELSLLKTGVSLIHFQEISFLIFSVKLSSWRRPLLRYTVNPSCYDCGRWLIKLLADLSLDARILYSSTSIEDILGYSPQEVIGKSCWEYFHPDEIPFARAIHGRGVQLDKAAVLNYCQIKNKDGRWVGCECVFTIVHDVLLGCTSVYRRGVKSYRKFRPLVSVHQS